LEKNSDAPRNFLSLGKAANINFASGSYYIFDNKVFRGSDIVKLDPSESPVEIEGQITFFSPHGLSRNIQNIENQNLFYSNMNIRVFSPEEIVDALGKILILDLENLENMDDLINKIKDEKKYKAILVRSYGLGNVPYPIKNAIENVSSEKIILNISRGLVSETSDRYTTSLGYVNKKSKYKVLSGHKMNKSVAIAFLTRVILEELSHTEAHTLLQKYQKERY
jgi:L-asparaginase/Glu-tRNA(Gln) amidotransferase subunit D